MVDLYMGNNALNERRQTMYGIKVKQLKEKLQEAIKKLDELDEDAKLVTSPNTYGMYGWVLEVPHTGFINIMEPEQEEDDEDEDDENV